MNRRNFLKNSGLATTSIAIPSIVPSTFFGKYAPSSRITVGMIGLGRQGYALLASLFARKDWIV